MQTKGTGRIVWRIGMKTKANGHRTRVELGRHIVADSKICGGQPTFKGTRIMVWIVLEQLEEGLSWEKIESECDGRVCADAIAEAIPLSLPAPFALSLVEIMPRHIREQVGRPAILEI